MVQRAFNCRCGVDECIVGHAGPPLVDRLIELRLRHLGPGHQLEEVPVEQVAPAPVGSSR